MTSRDAFPSSYAVARDRFRTAARRARLVLLSYPVGEGADPLAIDVAVGGNKDADRAIVLSSGLHGVEGYLGSAIQTEILLGALDPLLKSESFRVVLLHALNPYGFAEDRRTNGQNIDLNRNFLLPDEPYEGSPALYPRIDRWLNPKTPPVRGWPLPAGLAVDLFRHGWNALFHTIPVGQHDFPQGLFFGGRAPAPETRIVQDHLEEWIGAARKLVHLDFHTGLGRPARYQLLLGLGAEDPGAAWFIRHFGRKAVRLLPSESESDRAQGTRSRFYAGHGGFGEWCMWRFADRDYRFACAEFGTYSPIRVLSALRAENRVRHWGGDARKLDWARRNLVETFAPARASWRTRTLTEGIDLVRRAVQALEKDPSSTPRRERSAAASEALPRR